MITIMLCVLLLLRSMQVQKLEAVMSDLLDYYYISCPNGNVLSVSTWGGLRYRYKLISYSNRLTESVGSRTYGSETDIWGNTRFHLTGLLSGPSGMNDKTNFPQCVLEINDSLYKQRLFYPTFADSEIDASSMNGRRVYISFEHSMSYEETEEWISKLASYGNVTWLWVDTYGQTDMSNNPVTIQNPFESDALPLYGIPIYHDGMRVEEPLEAFLDILNHAMDDEDDNEMRRRLRDVKYGIKDLDSRLVETDIKIMGAVLLPVEGVNREQVLEELKKIDNVRCCT